MQEAHTHDEHSHGDHDHTHGVVNPLILTTQRGIWALKWSFVVLMVTAVFQIFVYFYSGSVALLADTIHNFADAATAIPLGIAFLFARRKPTTRFNYGYGRVEDLAGILIVLIIFASAVLAGYQSIERLLNPQPVTHLAALIIASLIGFLGNEAVAIFRIKVGKEIQSAALIADGYHARADGFTSLAVLFGAIGVWLGFPLADALVGLFISLLILKIVWEAGVSVFTRVLDGVEPEIIHQLEEETEEHLPDHWKLHSVKARWFGHKLHVELTLKVPSTLTVEKAHDEVHHLEDELMGHLNFISKVAVHFEPAGI